MVHVSLTSTVGPACNRCTNILTYTAQYIHTYTVLYVLYDMRECIYSMHVIRSVFSMCTFVLCIAIKNVCVHAYSLCWRSVRS